MKETLYSRNAVYESLRAGRREAFTLLVGQGAQEKGRLKEIIQLASQNNIPVQRTPRARLDKIHLNHQGVALEVSGYPYVNIADILDLASQRGEPLFVLLLDALQDPQNLGTLLRTAEAVGVHGAIIPLARTAQVTPAVVNASSGATEHLLIAQSNLHQAIGELKAAGAWMVGLDQAEGTLVGSKSDEALRGALGLVVGSEGAGMRPLVSKSCDFLLQLPMRGQVESLNAAVAGSVALYLAYLARKRTGD
jgi:23S rRNA (guanosine2251-2'-O)-methyltransferase